jgi:4'-phosphopantetheinyl transferase
MKMIAITTIDAADDFFYSLTSKWATAEEFAQTAHLRDIRRRAFLLGRATQRALLAEVTGKEDWHICPDTRGKPYAFTSSGKAGPHISISHTHNLVACAVSELGPIGIDVEYWRARDFTALAEYAFGKNECKEVTNEGISAFYRIWSLREAAAKATGVGLLDAIRNHDQFAGAPRSKWSKSAGFQINYSVPRSNYSLALAIKSPNPVPYAVLIDVCCAKNRTKPMSG